MKTYNILTECRSNGSRGCFEYTANNQLEATLAAQKQLGHAYTVIGVKVDEYDAYLEGLYGKAKVHINEWCGEISVSVTFEIAKTDWDAIKKRGDLGSLYAKDLSNYLSRQGKLNFYAAPIVNDKKRAKNGIKTISVSFSKRGN